MFSRPFRCFGFLRQTEPQKEASAGFLGRADSVRQPGMQRSSQGNLPGQPSGQQSSLLGGLSPRSYHTSWEDLPEHVAREITQRTNENDKIALFFASKQTRHPSMPPEIGAKGEFVFEMAREANSAQLMHAVLDELNQLPMQFRARPLEELSRNLSCIKDWLVQSSFDEIQFRSRKAAALYASLQEAIDQLPAAHRATALLNLSAYLELLPAAKRLPEMQRLLSRQGDPSLDALRGTLLKNFSSSLYIVHPQHAQSAAVFLLNESRTESRDIRDAVRENLKRSVDGLLLHEQVSVAIRSAIDAA